LGNISLDTSEVYGKIFLLAVGSIVAMNPEDLETKLIEVLQQIQSDSGYEGTPIGGTTCPTSDLEGFDSLLWAVAICMLEERLGTDRKIPETTNIFFDKDCRPLSIAESARLVYEIVGSKENL
jgi:hypothetical protein